MGTPWKIKLFGAWRPETIFIFPLSPYDGFSRSSNDSHDATLLLIECFVKRPRKPTSTPSNSVKYFLCHVVGRFMIPLCGNFRFFCFLARLLFVEFLVGIVSWGRRGFVLTLRPGPGRPQIRPSRARARHARADLSRWRRPQGRRAGNSFHFVFVFHHKEGKGGEKNINAAWICPPSARVKKNKSSLRIQGNEYLDEVKLNRTVAFSLHLRFLKIIT